MIRYCRVCGREFKVNDIRKRGRLIARFKRPMHCVTCSRKCSMKYTKHPERYKIKNGIH
jgi:hypothetical protein